MICLKTEWFKAWKNKRDLEGSPEEILPKVGLAAKDDDGRLLPTRAAVLLFAEFPDSLMADSRCAIRIFRYKDVEVNYRDRPDLLTTPVNLEGPIIKLIRDAHTRMLDILATGRQS